MVEDRIKARAKSHLESMKWKISRVGGRARAMEELLDHIMMLEGLLDLDTANQDVWDTLKLQDAAEKACMIMARPNFPLTQKKEEIKRLFKEAGI